MYENLANKIYLLRNKGSGKYLNIWGTDQAGNNRNVNQYDLSAELNQLFWIQKTPTSGVFKLSSVIQGAGKTYYSLNINGSTNNANLYEETITNDLDSALDFVQVGNQEYRISLQNPRADGTTLCLTALGNGNGTSSTSQVTGNVVWAENNDSAYQIWNLEYMTDYNEKYDLRKLDAQIFLHKFYGSQIAIDAQAGTALCRELVKALQRIVLDIDVNDPGYGNFGQATLSACPTLFVGMETSDKTKKIVTLFCHALFCKGYSPTAIYDTYNEKVAAGVKSFQRDAGLPENGIVSADQMKVIFNSDSYELSDKGLEQVRDIQKAMNGQYRDYAGIIPCDGIYSRDTNNALIYAIQKEVGISVENSAASFGPTTFAKFPTLPFTGDDKEQGCNELALTKILQYALFVNGYYSGDFDGVFNNNVTMAIVDFQNFMAYPEPISESATARVMKGLLASCGDQSRSCIACDTATILNESSATALYNAGYRYVGRYLTGTIKGNVSKALTRTEAKIILEAGLSIIPIYQDGGENRGHFSRSRGKADAENAYVAAKMLGIPDNSIIYFAVDFDALETDLSNILAYFDGVTRTIKDYYVGIYGTRNICSTVISHGGAYKCYVSDMSTGYSGNLGYRMPQFWAFDQFASATVLGLEIDKVAYSGEDDAVHELYEYDTSTSDFDDVRLNSKVHDKICDFQEDLPILLAQQTNGETPTDLIGNLPNFSYTKSWKYTLIDTHNLKIEYEVEIGASTTHEGSVMTIAVSDGKISATAETKISEAMTLAQTGTESFPVKPDDVTRLFSGLAVSIKYGTISISYSVDSEKGMGTLSLTCVIPDFCEVEGVTADFSQTLSITFGNGTVTTTENSYMVSLETMSLVFAAAAGGKLLETGRMLGTVYTILCNAGDYASMTLPKDTAKFLLVFGVIAYCSIGIALVL